MASKPENEKKISSIFDADDVETDAPVKKRASSKEAASNKKKSASKSSGKKPSSQKASTKKDMFEAEGDDLFGNDDGREGAKDHKYGRNKGEALSNKKSKYNRERYNRLFKTERYTRKSVKRDREYGMFWYDWLWHILRPVICFACALLVLLGVISIAWNRLYNGYIAPRNADDVTSYTFTVSSGESVTTIGNHLEQQGYISSASLFKYYIQFYGLTNKLQSGVYDLSPSMDLFEVATVLSSGKASNERTIRILPGWTVEDTADYLVGIGAIGSRDEFLSLCSNKQVNGKYPFEDYIDYSLALIYANENEDLSKRTYPLEGYLAPDTYRVYLTADASSILRTLIKQSDVVYNALFLSDGADESEVDEEGVRQYGAKGVTLSSDEIYTMASVIEKEASSAEDMQRVSAVFYNRLSQGMKLQSDPTATYLTGITSLALTSSQTQRQSPYNTYVVDGLPLGPICSPGRTALNAALSPDPQYLEENYLYFCAGEPGTGELIFAKTYAEHQTNVEKYRPLWEAYDREQASKASNN